MTPSFRSLLPVCLAAALAAPAMASAQYPEKPVTIIVPVPAGQSTDLLARLVAEKLAKSLGQPFIVENKAGAGTTIGTSQAAKARPDGYTLVMATSAGMAVAPHLYKKLPYDSLADFAPITNLATVIQTLVTSPGNGFKNAQDFAQKARGGSFNYASAGMGSTSHLTTELFLSIAGISAVHVPFKGAAEAQPQVIGERVEFMFDALPAVAPQIKSGRLQVLGVSSAQRTPLMPEVPTLAEQGFTGFEAIGWIGLAAPAGTPDAILETLNREVLKVMADPETRQTLDAMYFTAAAGTRQEFAAFIQAELDKWGRVAKTAGIEAQ